MFHQFFSFFSVQVDRHTKSIMQYLKYYKPPKIMLNMLSSVARYATAISKPKVFVAMKEVPKSAIDLLHERLATVYT